MADLVYLLLTVAFFAVAVGAVRLCERIIGPDENVGGGEVAASSAEDPTVAAPIGAGR